MTAADETARQLNAASALVDILTLARKKGLPPLDWSIGAVGVVMGRVRGLDCTTEQMRADYAAWAQALGMDHSPRWERDGILCLRAFNDHWGENKARVTVMAEIH